MPIDDDEKARAADLRGGAGDDGVTKSSGLGWVAITLDGAPLSTELAGAISLVLGSAAHGFVTCKGLELVPPETAAALLGITVPRLQALVAEGSLPSIPDGVGKFFDVREIIEHMALTDDAFDCEEPGPGRHR